jgi:hypothetical protein
MSGWNEAIGTPSSTEISLLAANRRHPGNHRPVDLLRRSGIERERQTASIRNEKRRTLVVFTPIQLPPASAGEIACAAV